MGAMPEEIAPILAKVGAYKSTDIADNRYYETNYNGVDLVIAHSKIGKVFSTLTASTMIYHFGVEKMLFSGVAGGINSALKIGDLLVAKNLCQHDLDITAFGHAHGFVPGGSQFVETDETLRKLASDVADEMGMSLQEGTIATGDQFIHDPERKAFIKSTFNADALEMEGASVAVVCAALDVPVFILRAISDTADTDADFNFDAFMESSAKISADFIMKMVDRLER